MSRSGQGVDGSLSKKTDRGIGQFVVYLIIVVFVVGAAWRWHSQQLVKGLNISGLHYMTEQEIREALDSTVVPAKVSDVHLQAIRLKLLQLPFVAQVNVQHGNDNSIDIEVKERQPIALCIRSNGDMQYLDNEAVVLPYRAIAGSNDLPVIRGLDPQGSVDTTIAHQMCEMLLDMQRERSALVYNDISELRYNEEKSSYILESSADGTQILFGGFENHSQKVHNLCSFFHYASQQNNQGAASLIDLRWSKKVFVTRRSAQR